MTQAQQIGSRMKKQRELLGLTREQLAEKLDITPRFCYDLELGLKGMSVSTLSKLSEALNITSDYLLFGEDREELGLAEGISLLKSCPVQKRSYLNRIISEYNRALKDV